MTKKLFSIVSEVLMAFEERERGNCVTIDFSELYEYKDVVPDYIFRCYSNYYNTNDDEAYYEQLQEALIVYARVLSKLI